jgi:leucine-zipper-like transcriptional regulator 1
MWLNGGYDGSNLNDVWYSSNGTTWTQATASASWSARSSHGHVVFDNKTWIIAGGDSGGSTLTDAWSSNDGITWSQASSTVPQRRAFTALVFDNKIWVMGGIKPGNNYLNDVWYSSDGATFTQATASASWVGRLDLTSVVFDNKI